MRDELMARASHELRVPLAAISNYGHLLEEEIYGPLTEPQRSAVQKIRKCTKHLQFLVRELLDLATIDGGQPTLDIGRVDLHALCRDVVETAHVLARNKEVAIELELSADVPPIETDSRRLRQILLNLLANALKFTSDGIVRLTLAASEPSHETEGAQRQSAGAVEGVVISISDTGIGIPSSRLPHIFEPFNTWEEHATQASGGMGLGLAIAKQLADQLQASIDVHSELDVGSVFDVNLPLTVEVT